MSASVVEVTFLEGIDLEGFPPCGAFTFENGRRLETLRRCADPSIARVEFSHCKRETVFLCRRCLDNTQANLTVCMYCDKQGGYEWREA